MSLLTLYFLQNWVPQLVANAGQTDSQAFSAGTILNVGLFGGMASVGYFADRYGLRRVIATYLGATAIVLLSFSTCRARPRSRSASASRLHARRVHRPLCRRRADLPGRDPDHRHRLGDRLRAPRRRARPVDRGLARGARHGNDRQLPGVRDSARDCRVRGHRDALARALGQLARPPTPSPKP